MLKRRPDNKWLCLKIFQLRLGSRSYSNWLVVGILGIVRGFGSGVNRRLSQLERKGVGVLNHHYNHPRGFGLIVAGEVYTCIIRSFGSMMSLNLHTFVPYNVYMNDDSLTGRKTNISATRLSFHKDHFLLFFSTRMVMLPVSLPKRMCRLPPTRSFRWSSIGGISVHSG
jgi:hypothetical protein